MNRHLTLALLLGVAIASATGISVASNLPTTPAAAEAGDLTSLRAAFGPVRDKFRAEHGSDTRPTAGKLQSFFDRVMSDDSFARRLDAAARRQDKQAAISLLVESGVPRADITSFTYQIPPPKTPKEKKGHGFKICLGPLGCFSFGWW